MNYDDLIYVPGSWVCDVCDFVLTKSFLAPTGEIAVNNEEYNERCPNDRELMRREKWRDLAERQEEMIRDLLRDARRH